MTTVKGMVAKEFLSIDKDETISKLLGKLRGKKRVALVFQGNKFLGVVRKVDLLKSKLQLQTL